MSLFALGTFFVLGEISTRTFNLVDRLNDFPRQLYQATDDEDLPYVLRPSIDTVARGQRVVIDENRMRVADTPRPGAPGDPRILILGDSVAFGYRLPFDQTLGDRLEAALARDGNQPHTVLNGAVEGYNTQNQLAWLRRYGLALEPDVVLVIFNLNDYDYGPVMGPNGILTTDRSQRVSTRSLANLSDFYVLLRWLVKLGAARLSAPAATPPAAPAPAPAAGQVFADFDRFVSALRKRYYQEPTDERWPTLLASLRGLRDETARRDIPLLIAIVPDGDQIGVTAPDRTPQERLVDICQQEDLPCLDLYDAFQRHADEGPLFLDIMHPNPRGHAIIADALVPWVRERSGATRP